MLAWRRRRRRPGRLAAAAAAAAAGLLLLAVAGAGAVRAEGGGGGEAAVEAAEEALQEAEALGLLVDELGEARLAEEEEEEGGAGEAAAAAAAPAAEEGEATPKDEEEEETEEQRLKRADELLNRADQVRYAGGSGAERLDRVGEAAGLYAEAAELGSAEALSLLGEAALLGWAAGPGGAAREPNATEAFALFDRAADLGWPDAQRYRGFMYAVGLGRPADPAESLLNYFFAATGGSAGAQMALGYRHLQGLGTPKACEASVKYYLKLAERAVAGLVDDEQPPYMVERARLESGDRSPEEDEDVVQYYEHSAENGDASAQHALGQLRYYGARGVERDAEAAARYFRAAAAQNHAGAMSRLAGMYLRGEGVEANNATAVSLWRRAAAAGSASALNGLGYAYLHGRGVPRSYARALKHLKDAAAKGHSGALFNLGVAHFSGLGTARDFTKAMNAFARAGHQGHTRALYNLAQMHLNGMGAQPSCDAAIRLLKTVAERGKWAASLQDAHARYVAGDTAGAAVLYARCAEEGYEVAQSNLAWLLESESADGAGDGVLPGGRAPGSRVAVRHLEQAAAQGNVAAHRRLGDHHWYGRGVAGGPNRTVAARHYTAAGEQGDAEALFNLGYMHEHGLGLPRDLHLSKRLYDRALAADPDAYVPVRLALFKLWVHGLVERHWPELLGREPAPAAAAAAAAPPRRRPAQAAKKKKSLVTPWDLATAPARRAWKAAGAALAGEHAWTGEDALLAALSACLAVVVLLRARNH